MDPDNIIKKDKYAKTQEREKTNKISTKPAVRMSEVGIQTAYDETGMLWKSIQNITRVLSV